MPATITDFDTALSNVRIGQAHPEALKETNYEDRSFKIGGDPQVIGFDGVHTEDKIRSFIYGRGLRPAGIMDALNYFASDNSRRSLRSALIFALDARVQIGGVLCSAHFIEDSDGVIHIDFFNLNLYGHEARFLVVKDES